MIPLLELERSEFLEQNIGTFGKGSRKTLESIVPEMFSTWGDAPAKAVYLKTDVDLTALALHVGSGNVKETEGFLLDETKTKIGLTTPFCGNVDLFRGREQPIHEVNGTTIGHGQLKPDYIARGTTSPVHLSLDTDMAFGVDHGGEISKMPLCEASVHTHIVP